MISPSEGMSAADANAEQRLEEFQRKFKQLDEWAKELRQTIKSGDLQGVTDCTAQLMVEVQRLSEEGAFKDEDQS